MDSKIYCDILIIEDDIYIRDLIDVLAIKYAVSIKFAKNTEEFLKLISLYDFKYVLCDLNLDFRLEGFVIAQVFKNFRNEGKVNGKIYSFTSEKQINPQLLEKSFDDVLQKEINQIISFFEKKFIEIQISSENENVSKIHSL